MREGGYVVSFKGWGADCKRSRSVGLKRRVSSFIV